MHSKEKFHQVLDKVRKTFEILRETLSETPSEPTRALHEQADQDNLTLLDRTRHSTTNQMGYAKASQSNPGDESTPLSEARQRYIEGLMIAYEYVRLPGFSIGSQPLKVPFEKAYVPLSFLDKRIGAIRPERDDGFYGGAGALSLASALQRYRRLVIIGCAGSGKTSLLVALLLADARSLRGERMEISSSQANRDSTGLIPFDRQHLYPAEDDHLPILLSLRELGQYLEERYRSSGKDGAARLLNYLRESPLVSEGSLLSLHENFFEAHLVSGKALVLMDGLDDVENPALRQRVVRMIEKFVKRYPACRYVVTSRPLGSDGVALLGEQFGTVQIREFSPFEARQFARAWWLTLEKGLAGAETAEALGLAKQRADELVGAMHGSQRMTELATSPLAIIALTLVQRSRGQWPEHRADLYETALKVLLDQQQAASRPAQYNLDCAEERRTLEMIAFWLHQHNRCEIRRADLSAILQPWFLQICNGNEMLATEAVENFLQFIAGEDSGLFVEQRTGVYGFTQRTFQEVLAAHALAEREDTLAYTLKCLPSLWWREVILFEAGFLGRQAKHRVSELIWFILDAGPQAGLQLYHSTFLAAECMFDLDPKHLESSLAIDIKKSLKKLVNAPVREGDRQGLVDKLTASNALVGLQGGQAPASFWKLPYGEPEWINIPAGEFWMGEAGQVGDNFAQRVFLPEYQISRAPVTNAQYALYLRDTGAEPPDHWRAGQSPKGRENHPVVNINWHEALAYCAWLGEKIIRPVSLPSEAEWEKAARGDQDQREYPWGTWVDLRANTSELALGDTTPVGLFPNGASPFGLLDMTGNVREWTRSLFDFGYPYDPADKTREDLQAPDDQPRVLRGGSFYHTRNFARCAHRQRYYPDFRFYNFGFRMVILPQIC